MGSAGREKEGHGGGGRDGAWKGSFPRQSKGVTRRSGSTHQLSVDMAQRQTLGCGAEWDQLWLQGAHGRERW